MRRLLAVILVLAGIGLLIYPTARERYFDYRRQRLLEAWEAARAGITPPDSGGSAPEASEPPADDRPDPALEKYIQENMIGVLRIPAIDLELPVLKRDSEADLDISAAHVSGSAGPGESGNFCIAGHRQLAYGRHFNRLHEVVVGDLIEFSGTEETFIYRAVRACIIQPEETGVLDNIGDERLITLITCHGSRRPFTRFVVQGRLELSPIGCD